MMNKEKILYPKTILDIVIESGVKKSSRLLNCLRYAEENSLLPTLDQYLDANFDMSNLKRIPNFGEGC